MLLNLKLKKTMAILNVVFLFIVFSHSTLADCGCNKATNREESPTHQNDDHHHDHEGDEGLLDLMKHENDYKRMTMIPEGHYKLGAKTPIFPADHELERDAILEDNFYLDKYEVSNKDFEEFVKATKYITDAEKFGDSFVFKAFLDEETQKKYHDFRVAAAPWWYKINGSDWRHPFGPASSIDEMMDHPVVHVSWRDAKKFCEWRGKRLPTESEWEVACRGGKRGRLFPWGDSFMPKGDHLMNIWQGEFPDGNTMEDGFAGTSPVDSFKQNGYDLYNIVGNVWEWTSTYWNPNDEDDEQSETPPNRVKKGGSYMCHHSYCYRYRCAARSQNTEDSSSGNLGFRCAKNFK